MANKSYDTKKSGRVGRPIDCERRPRPGLKDTLFAREFCTAWIDEAHDFRGGKALFVGAVHLRRRAKFLAGLTATPLHSSARVSFALPLRAGGMGDEVARTLTDIAPRTWWP